MSINTFSAGSSSRKQCGRLIMVLLALCLTIVPMPMAWQWLRPVWVLLILIDLIWQSVAVPFVLIWILGLVVDLLLGTPLGMHALIYCIVGSMAQRLRAWSIHWSALQQAAWVGVLAVVAQTIQGLVLHAVGLSQGVALWIGPAIISMLLWPLLRSITGRESRLN